MPGIRDGKNTVELLGKVYDGAGLCCDCGILCCSSGIGVLLRQAGGAGAGCVLSPEFTTSV